MKSTEPYSGLLTRISGKIKRLRTKAGWTQEDMTKHGFNYRHYQKLESGTYSPSLQTLHRVAKVFKVNVRDLF